MIRQLILLLFSAPLLLNAQNNNGISFSKSAWNDILQQAKREKKIIFLDAYATWCGPCKKMSADVFTTQEAGNFFNRNFINAKIDMESGEGPGLADKYDVGAYPTLLFINSDGKLLHKAIGYLDTDEFIAKGLEALDPGKQFYTLRGNYATGTLTDDQLYRLASTAITLEDPLADKIVNTYLNKKTNWLTEPCINLMLNMSKDPSDLYFGFLSKNEKAAGELAGISKVTDGLDQIAFQAIAGEIPESDPIKLAVKKVETGMKKYRPAPAARRFSLRYGIYMANEINETGLYKEYLVGFLDEFGNELEWSDLNQYAWDFFEQENNKTMLQSALGWALKSISKNSNFYNNDTAAQLHFKLGNKKEALKYAETAIKLGNAAGEDVTETENLLKKLK